jgi:hypothetical protein
MDRGWIERWGTQCVREQLALLELLLVLRYDKSSPDAFEKSVALLKVSF